VVLAQLVTTAMEPTAAILYFQPLPQAEAVAVEDTKRRLPAQAVLVVVVLVIQVLEVN
jgi:hypothetical protein